VIHLVVTLGDPTSIGPEVASKALSSFLRKHRDAEVTAIGALGKENARSSARLDTLIRRHKFNWVDLSPLQTPTRGRRSAAIALEALRRATDICLEGDADALVTGPLDKNLCSKVEPHFRGHTEYLQERCRVKGTTMMLAGKDLRVCLVTTHLAHRDVSKFLTTKKIVSSGQRTYGFIRRLKRKPIIAVCALNPHASDGGLFGDEEKRIIQPAVRTLQKEFGKDSIVGPYPADTLFALSKNYDAILCMYHDQGLIPLKMKHFYDGVNITIGLPFLRTSVDHGTAFDIAGKERASSQSFESALDYAYLWVKSKKKA